MPKITKCWNCGNEVKKINYASYVEIPTCPKCGVQYPEKPKLEAKLTLLQNEYFSNPTDSNFQRLFEPLKELTFHIICHYLNKTSTFLDSDEINDMVQWTLCKLVSYYKEKEGFKITGSFTGYIEQVVLYPIYNKKDKERRQNEKSLFTPLDEGTKSRTLLDKLAEQSTEAIGKEDIDLSSIYTDEIITTLVNTIQKIVNKKRQNSLNTGAEYVLTSCIGCMIALNFTLKFNKKVMRIIDFLRKNCNIKP